METCFAPLIRWVPFLVAWGAAPGVGLGCDQPLRLLRGAGRQCSSTAAALPPLLGRFLSAHQQEAWQPHWKQLFGQIAEGILGDWFALVWADRGLYARWLYQDTRRRGWYPFLRIHS